MNPTTAEGVRFCASCGDPADTLDAEENGPCCHNLPNPWHRGSEGLYNQTSASEDFEDEDEISRAMCGDCGSERWLVTATQVVGSDEEGGETVYYEHGSFEATSARCAHCDTPMPSHYDLEAY